MNRLKMLYYNFVYKLVSKLPFTAIGNVFKCLFYIDNKISNNFEVEDISRNDV